MPKINRYSIHAQSFDTGTYVINTGMANSADAVITASNISKLPGVDYVTVAGFAEPNYADRTDIYQYVDGVFYTANNFPF
jgi:hypothetical protein